MIAIAKVLLMFLLRELFEHGIADLLHMHLLSFFQSVGTFSYGNNRFAASFLRASAYEQFLAVFLFLQHFLSYTHCLLSRHLSQIA